MSQGNNQHRAVLVDPVSGLPLATNNGIPQVSDPFVRRMMAKVFLSLKRYLKTAGTVTKIITENGVETVSSHPITKSDTIRANETVNSQTGTTYIVLDSDRGSLVTFSNSSSIAVTLPQAGTGLSFLNKWFVDFENRGAGVVTITPTTSNIDGATTLVLLRNQGCRVITDGTNYFTTARGTAPTGVDYLINGGFDFIQRSTTPTINSVAYGGPNTADTYTIDRWKANTDSAKTWQVGNGSSGPNSANYGYFDNTPASSSKILIYQPIESNASIALSNSMATVTFQCQMQMPTSSVKINIGILQWTGTADTLPANGVMTAWSSTTGVDPTFASGYTMTGKASFTATSSWQQISASTVIAASVNNIVPIIWMDAQPALSSGVLNIAEAKFTVDPTIKPWIPRLIQQELALCERYCQAKNSVTYTSSTVATGIIPTTSTGQVQWYLPVFMRTQPTLTVTASDLSIRAGAGVTVLTALTLGTGGSNETTMQLNATVAGTPLIVGNGAFLTFNAANKILFLDAEL